MDRDLVVAAQMGDRGAFETLALRSHPRLQSVAVGIPRDPHLAEDALQQALMDIWRDLPGLRDPSRFEGWSYRLLVRVCHAEARRRPKSTPQDSIPEADEPHAADAYEAIIYRDELERAFRRLSVEQRTVIVFHRLMEMPVERVAEILDIPLGTVKSRLSRAMDGLRAAIQADARAPANRPARQEVTP